MTEQQKLPLPPFTKASAIEKIRLAEDGWNSRNPAKVALAYSLDTRWRNRDTFVQGRQQAEASQPKVGQRIGVSAHQRVVGLW